MSEQFSGFGEPLVQPSALTDKERFAILERAVGRLRTDVLDEYTRRWLSDAIERALAGESLDEVLGLRGVQKIAQRVARDALRVQLAADPGNELLRERLRQEGIGTSRTSVWRARVSRRR